MKLNHGLVLFALCAGALAEGRPKSVTGKCYQATASSAASCRIEMPAGSNGGASGRGGKSGNTAVFFKDCRPNTERGPGEEVSTPPIPLANSIPYRGRFSSKTKVEGKRLTC
ncbi:hypothetical protein PCL_03291 [Purpureocillium lilacinum]|uniref:Uncharacterized protein n=1 Tax=Purpureocillium lilacinum TaxID=33203 RepID=A0A2U3ENL2_PURLI|nr:hypothetical protein PCL_03291 [Purpureocillium lilacinum]